MRELLDMMESWLYISIFEDVKCSELYGIWFSISLTQHPQLVLTTRYHSFQYTLHNPSNQHFPPSGGPQGSIRADVMKAISEVIYCFIYRFPLSLEEVICMIRGLLPSERGIFRHSWNGPRKVETLVPWKFSRSCLFTHRNSYNSYGNLSGRTYPTSDGIFIYINI